MPLPKPNKNEKRDIFINRCMSNDTMNEEYSNNEQRYAVCENIWENRKKMAKDIIGDIKKELIRTKKDFENFGIKKDFDAGFELKEDSVEEKDGHLYVKGYACTSDTDLVLDSISEEAMVRSEKDLLRSGCTSVFFNHDEDIIIGKVVDSFYDGKGIFVTVKISNASDVNDYKIKIKEGMLNSFSIRGIFKTIEIIKNENGDIINWNVKEMDLLEVSLVGLPCNRFASVMDVIEKKLKLDGLTKNVGKKSKNSSKTNLKNNKRERSNEMPKEKKVLILEVLKEHANEIIDEKINEAISKSIEPMKDQINKVGDLIEGFVFENKKETGKDKKKNFEDGNEGETDEDNENLEDDKKTIVPEWAKSLTETVGNLNDRFAEFEKNSSKRKGYQRTEEDEDDENRLDNDIPRKSLKSIEDEDTAKYVGYLMNNTDEYNKLNETDKAKAKSFMFMLINENSKKES